jgi:cellulose synthase/poly-beta-1,6-N-acetylglucosamine synthase-like glycosyltransferase
MTRVSPQVDLLALVLCIVFLAYVAAILIPYLRHAPARLGRPEDFSWHFFVPCLNEEEVVARSVSRLRNDHPLAHVWCIDDASTDSTPEVLSRLAQDDEHLHVVSRRPPFAQRGKGDALNDAWTHLRDWLATTQPDHDPAHVVVGVLDADGRLAPDALAVIAGEGGFGDPEVGAVQVQVRMLNRGLARPDADDPVAETRFGRLLVTLQDLEFRTVIAAMQHLRHRLGSAGMGGNGQFSRLSALDAIADGHGTPWHGSLLEDFELGLHVLLTGRRNRYCDDTWVAQEGLPDLRALVRQRTRWAQGGMQCVKYLRAVLASPLISTPSALEIAYFLLVPWTQLLGTVVYVAAGVSIGWFAIHTPGGVQSWFVSGAWGLIPLVVLFGIAPIAIWAAVYRRGEPTVGRGRALVLGLTYWLYTFVMVAAVWRGAWRILRSRGDWVKTARVVRHAEADPHHLNHLPDRQCAVQTTARPTVQTVAEPTVQTVAEPGVQRSHEPSHQRGADPMLADHPLIAQR